MVLEMYYPSQLFSLSFALSQPKLSEPAIATNHNKQALLSFWYNACVDCHENVRLIVQNPAVTKNIAFNYILADHDDQEVVLFNRGMLPAYYGILRLCCELSAAFTRQLASHQNIQWAFKNLTPHASQYPGVGVCLSVRLFQCLFACLSVRPSDCPTPCVLRL